MYIYIYVRIYSIINNNMPSYSVNSKLTGTLWDCLLGILAMLKRNLIKHLEEPSNLDLICCKNSAHKFWNRAQAFCIKVVPTAQ